MKTFLAHIFLVMDKVCDRYLVPHVHVQHGVKLLHVDVDGPGPTIAGLGACRVFLLLLNPDCLVNLLIRLPAFIIRPIVTSIILAVLSLQ